MASDEVRLDMFLDSALNEFDYEEVLEHGFYFRCFNEMELRFPTHVALENFNNAHASLCKDRKYLIQKMLFVRNVHDKEAFCKSIFNIM